MLVLISAMEIKHSVAWNVIDEQIKKYLFNKEKYNSNNYFP